MKKAIFPPIAKQIPKSLIAHDDKRVDNYFWLNDREDQEVIDYLNAENAYTNKVLKHTEFFQKALFEEMKGRIKEDDTSVPYKLNGFWYITKFEKGKDYPIYTRKKDELNAVEELMFDCNEMAKNYSFFKLGSISISPNNTLAAFSQDTVSRRQYTIKIRKKFDIKDGGNTYLFFTIDKSDSKIVLICSKLT